MTKRRELEEIDFHLLLNSSANPLSHLTFELLLLLLFSHFFTFCLC